MFGETVFSGTVVAALLNHPGHPALVPGVATAAPYKAAPQWPVLGVRPPGCVQHTRDARWAVPTEAQTVLCGASLGMLIGRPAVRVEPEQALDCVSDWLLCVDGSWPVPNHYRPGLRWRARDGLCVLGTQRLPRVPGDDPLQFVLQLCVDDQAPCTLRVAEHLRGPAQLLADVSQFMTLNPGDVLLLGHAEPQPELSVGQRAYAHLQAPGRPLLALSVSLALAAAAPPQGQQP
jgi:5-oxopent-3-ene-1,2,5-tricarboxylate decarboxylase/2-hydroxyhepta-2,4-diene-1,7-dioate isomerase